jgi:hypothetical protein
MLTVDKPVDVTALTAKNTPSIISTSSFKDTMIPPVVRGSMKVRIEGRGEVRTEPK